MVVGEVRRSTGGDDPGEGTPGTAADEANWESRHACSTQSGASKSWPIVDEHQGATVATLSERFGVSEATVRRDLMQLDRRGLVERAHGGAVPRRVRRDDGAPRAADPRPGRGDGRGEAPDRPGRGGAT